MVQSVGEISGGSTAYSFDILGITGTVSGNIESAKNWGRNYIASFNVGNAINQFGGNAYLVLSEISELKSDKIAQNILKGHAVGLFGLGRVVDLAIKDFDERETYVQIGGLVGDIAGIPLKFSIPGAILGYSLSFAGEWAGGFIYDHIVPLVRNSETPEDPNILATPPIVMDLDGDGVELINLDQSAVFFDIDADGYLENTGWAGGDDGILTIDLNANGVIDHADEFVFTRHAPGTTSDLAALRQAFDSNQDGILDDRDARWADFRVWQDLDQDGQSDAGELKTLAELGITAIGLSSVPYVPAAGATPGPKDSTINALASYTKADGSIGMLSAAAARRPAGSMAALW